MAQVRHLKNANANEAKAMRVAKTWLSQATSHQKKKQLGQVKKGEGRGQKTGVACHK